MHRRTIIIGAHGESSHASAVPSVGKFYTSFILSARSATDHAKSMNEEEVQTLYLAPTMAFQGAHAAIGACRRRPGPLVALPPIRANSKDVPNGVQASDAADYAELRMATYRHHRVTEVSEKHCLVNHIKRLMNRNGG